MIFQAACNRVVWLCGCTSWDQLESGVWVRRNWPCNRHEVDKAAEAHTVKPPQHPTAVVAEVVA